jgi:phenylacetate-coenzyme A ligase PaaK-like adenylate-forming protein
MDLSKYELKIFAHDAKDFESLALEIFQLQYNANPVYHDFVNALKINAATVQSIAQIPFLPIRFFKSHAIQTTSFDAEAVFESSGTTGSINSRHLVKDLELYKKSFSIGFQLAYGPAKDWCIIGLLPSYLERGNSSLIYMVNELVRQSDHPESGFYLNEYDKLFTTLTKLEKEKQKTILIGVTFALLDVAEKYSLPMEHTIIMETGGMKGRKEEIIRAEVHGILQRSFNVPVIHSEYGMTELLSQAYSKGNGIFHCPRWMKVLIRDDEDPLHVSVARFQTVAPLTGAINIIDLANLYSCSFIATDDAGKLYDDGSFEVLGRIDNSDLRGCSLMTI